MPGGWYPICTILFAIRKRTSFHAGRFKVNFESRPSDSSEPDIWRHHVYVFERSTTSLKDVYKRFSQNFVNFSIFWRKYWKSWFFLENTLISANMWVYQFFLAKKALFQELYSIFQQTLLGAVWKCTIVRVLKKIIFLATSGANFWPKTEILLNLLDSGSTGRQFPKFLKKHFFVTFSVCNYEGLLKYELGHILDEFKMDFSNFKYLLISI